MDQNKRLCWIDALIILALVVFVYILCQPWGRDWDDATREMFSGEEGAYLPDPDSYYYLRRAREYTEKGFSSIVLFSDRASDEAMTTVEVDSEEKIPQLLSVIAAVLWFVFRWAGIQISIYSICIHPSQCICFCGGVFPE